MNREQRRRQKPAEQAERQAVDRLRLKSMRRVNVFDAAALADKTGLSQLDALVASMFIERLSDYDDGASPNTPNSPDAWAQDLGIDVATFERVATTLAQFGLVSIAMLQ